MIALFGYAIVAVITTIFLAPLLKFGKEISAYICVFGIVYGTLLLTGPSQNFEASWIRYVGVIFAFICVVFFVLRVRSLMMKKAEIELEDD